SHRMARKLGPFSAMLQALPRNFTPDTFDWTSAAMRASMWTRQEAAFPGGVMSTVVSRVRRSSRRSQSRVPRTRRPVPSRARAVVSTEPTFAEIAAQYLERHIERYLVPRAAQLARYAHAYLATVSVPGLGGASMRFTEKPFRQITTAD